MIHEAGEDDAFDYYIVHDSRGVTHVLKKGKGDLPMIKCTNCSD